MGFKILALGGGGSKGYLHIGALKFLEEKYGNLQKKFTGGFYGCSIGSVFAIALAFGLNLEAIIRMSTMFSSLGNIVMDNLTVKGLESSIAKKGLFDLDTIQEFFAKMFDSEGINIRDKMIGDAPYPLFICSSNISRKKITVFKGQVPILQAMGASCCIPVLFCPKVINDNAYVDGGFLTDIILNYVPEQDRNKTLSISIIHDDPKIIPSKLEKMSTLNYLYGLYKVSCLYENKRNKCWNNLDLHHSLASGISDVGEKERNDMIAKGYDLTHSFFAKNSN
jgi:NTE family protein